MLFLNHCDNLRIMTASKKLLCQVLVKIQENKAKNLHPLLVFDLDSTLYDVSPRSQKIVHDFAEIHENMKKFPKACSLLKQVSVLREDWGIKTAIIRAGITDESPEFYQSMMTHWKKHFFSNEYLKYDKPYPGAVEFVNKAYDLGAQIIYLTGRDVHRMGEGSAHVLVESGFPLEGKQSSLILKPNKEMDDALFKKDCFEHYAIEKHGYIAFFENEPVNINLVNNHFNHIDIIIFESTHSGQEEHPDHLPRIQDFIFE